MADHDRDQDDPATGEGDSPSLRQRLHAATGDRDAEARALADRAGDEVDETAAKRAVQWAHGDAGVGGDMPDSELASPADAEAVQEGEGPEAG